MIDQGGVRVNAEKVVDRDLLLKAGEPFVLQVGKRKFARVVNRTRRPERCGKAGQVRGGGQSVSCGSQRSSREVSGSALDICAPTATHLAVLRPWALSFCTAAAFFRLCFVCVLTA